ncbi:Crp/Fnr family transcriptional regulator [Isobaculum melis]|uniref:cAMP-binding domain of CRP or a regulatory subunit of cAMP-dependent protein kinases n=1 Tax=Isobaculum melis TaxID=142588 RepID=A0A1H9QIF1_9LACT|nr:Crp/Fnr family transcriptional regulator [Isobaculum melis]SER60242.1 cAMP-binding domain of CRP or a regulatory subunit of cAMP-dependent protein kinases [Isobaculum melis]
MEKVRRDPTYLQKLRREELFVGFTDEEFDIIQSNLFMRHYKKGQILFDEGDRRDRVYFLRKGLVRLERYDESATFSYFDYVKKHTLFPYGGMFHDEDYHYSAYAVTDIEVYYIPMQLFEETVKNNQEQLIYVFHKLSKILENHEVRLQRCLTSSATERIEQALAILMKDLGEAIAPHIVEIPYPITLKELATMSGTTRETVGHTIKKLKQEKKIEYEHKMFVFSDIHYFKAHG